MDDPTIKGGTILKTVRDFAAAQPYVRLSLTTGTREELFHPVKGGLLDMVVSDPWRALSDRSRCSGGSASVIPEYLWDSSMLDSDPCFLCYLHN